MVFLAHALCGVCLLTAQRVGAQATVPGNLGGPGDYAGWNGTTTIPLEVRHNGNQRIQWFTDSIQRMQLSPTLTGQNWGWYSTGNLDLSGHLGIGSPVPVRPLTYLHLNSAGLGAITVGYRPWMKVGVFSTQGSDGLYSGMRAVNGQTEGVINWSDDDGASGQMDPLCFVFTSTPDSSSAASTFRGLEIARMAPATSGDEGFLGVGDRRTAGLTPAERFKHRLDL